MVPIVSCRRRKQLRSLAFVHVVLGRLARWRTKVQLQIAFSFAHVILLICKQADVGEQMEDEVPLQLTFADTMAGFASHVEQMCVLHAGERRCNLMPLSHSQFSFC